jgi:hypothetical protein
MGKSEKVGKMRFYPMPTGWRFERLLGPAGNPIQRCPAATRSGWNLIHPRSDDTRETTFATKFLDSDTVSAPRLHLAGHRAGVGILLWLLSPVLTPFLLGAILAYILQPGVAWMVRRRVPRGLAALLMMLLFTLLITLLVLLVLAVVIQKEGPQLRQQVPVLFAHAARGCSPSWPCWASPIRSISPASAIS